MAEQKTHTLAAVCAALGLGAPWIPILERLDDDLSDPVAWSRRFITDTEPVTLADLRVVALRMHGLGPTRIASSVGRRSIPPRHQIARICLAVAVRLADTGRPNTAEPMSHVGTTGHRLVHEGIPRYTDDPISQSAFNQLWLEGLPLGEIRAALAIGPKLARAHAAAAPTRWTGSDIQAFFGWSPANHGLRLARGHFPKPDGREGAKGWWWPTTITEWAASQPFVRCPECDASVVRLKQHLTKHERDGKSPGS